MAFGFNFGGGDFLPIVKYDARSGRISRRDRENGETTEVDITKTFKAVFDFENVEVGWISFAAGGAPDFRMVKHGSGAWPQKPSDTHKQGIRFLVKLHGSCGGDVREMASNAGAFLEGISKLHDEYLAQVKDHPGKLPIVVFEDSYARATGSGDRKSTNYVPVFNIEGWTKRPEDLVYTPRDGSGQPPASAPAASNKFAGPNDDVPFDAAPARSTPPATGSTRAAPPKVTSSDSDFG